LRRFLGITGCYRRFVQGYGRITKPLTQLLTKEGFNWSDEAQQSLEAFKSVVSQLSMLAVLDFTKPFTLQTDASSRGPGAVLLQNSFLLG